MDRENVENMDGGGVNGLDVALVVCAIAAFVGGYRRGLVSRVCTWVGAVLGVLLVGDNIDSLLSVVGDPPKERRILFIVGLLIGGWFLGRMVGWFLGDWIQGRLPSRPLRTANRWAGGAVGVLGVGAIVWLALPLFGQLPGWPAATTRSSAISRTIDEVLPQPPSALGSVRRLVEGGRFPQVLEGLQRSIDGGDPPSTAALDAETVARVSRSVVKVSSVACGVLSDGTGVIVPGGNVLTNAHVVAGAVGTTVVSADGQTFEGRVVRFDAANDLALIRVSAAGLGDALEFADPDLGEELAVFGHPGGGPQRIAPVGLRERLRAAGKDIYDAKSTERPVMVLSGRLEPGDSGAPVVNRSGQMVGLAFAVAPDRRTTAYAVPVETVQRFLDGGPGSEDLRSDTDGVSSRCIEH